MWRSELDRDALVRMRPDALSLLLADAATRVLLVRRGSALVDSGGLALQPLAALPEGAVERADAVVYLGRTLTERPSAPRGAPILAVAVDQETADSLTDAQPDAQRDAQPGAQPDAQWANLRTFGSSASRFDIEALTQALALINWHASHGFSPRTGVATEPVHAGWVRRGVDPDHDIYPRIDPSVIVAVLDAEDRILLGSNAMWEKNRFSLLAGFVEPGESLEAAVEREILEESGLRVTDARYLGSQPWPFPASLMLGFTARVEGGELRPDGEEILDLRWFSRQELAASLDQIVLPGRVSIARAIIEHWFGGEIEDGAAGGWSR
ncbi:NAD(+) diphosphatase [Salinibacterium sp. SYSU T00001]|uniref:NAD(+) diphosphatase n=1 Tax=Homoserinimonas sedimenticola TaxID=2986805 RepID=UPI002235AC33|nr:NAD(+) diphosphatase [Salinibacterium sedimenticola]MCW4386525.1 NAD(+) diphosphatase [Salinibacterium sedimenticola]